MNVMLLAAGEGTRLRPFTEVLPKPAIPFLTVPLAAHALSFLNGDSKQRIDKLVVNTFHLPNKIHELFQQIQHGAKTLHFSDEVGEILGGGGGLGKARQHFLGGGDFVMMNADEVILPKDVDILAKAFEHHEKSNAFATLMVMDHHGVGSQFGGVWTNSNNKVLGFGKTAPTQSEKGWHFVGVLILSEKVFSYIPPSGASNILYDVLTVAINNGELIQAFPFECEWFETGNPHDFFEACEKCFQFLASTEKSFQKDALFKTIKNFFGEPLTVESQENMHLVKAESATIDNTAKLEGLVILGKNSRVHNQSVLKNVIVADNINVPSNTEAFNTFILK
ncbi:MAG: sugar phosphate nucleotidyltransferase [Pseudobdellovibrionaceae bacterium]